LINEGGIGLPHPQSDFPYHWQSTLATDRGKNFCHLVWLAAALAHIINMAAKWKLRSGKTGKLGGPNAPGPLRFVLCRAELI